MAGIDSCCETCDVSCQLLCCYSVDLAERDQMISRFPARSPSVVPRSWNCYLKLALESMIKHDHMTSFASDETSHTVNTYSQQVGPSLILLI